MTQKEKIKFSKLKQDLDSLENELKQRDKLITDLMLDKQEIEINLEVLEIDYYNLKQSYKQLTKEYYEAQIKLDYFINLMFYIHTKWSLLKSMVRFLAKRMVNKWFMVVESLTARKALFGNYMRRIFNSDK